MRRQETAQILGTYNTRQEALAFGKLIAQAQVPSQLLIYTEDGALEISYTYG